MDESWRMRMGTTSLATRRRASEDFTSADSGQSFCLSGATDADDFNDVFGGPPRSVLNRKLSCDFTAYDYFYREIFHRQEPPAERGTGRIGRRIPQFRIPASRGASEEAGFQSDVLESPSNCQGGDDDRRGKKSSSSSRLWRSLSLSKWKSKSKSDSNTNSSSVLSYEDPIRSGVGADDVALTSYAAKLRPINVPSRWHSSNAMGGIHKNQNSENPIEYSHSCYRIDNSYPQSEYNVEQLMNPGLSQPFPSPETHLTYSTTIVDDVGCELESPSSANSTFYDDPQSSEAKFLFNASYEQSREAEEDEFLSSHVIEINSRERRMTDEADDIDEAIAWAKGKYQGCTSSSGELNVRQHESNYQFGEFEG